MKRQINSETGKRKIVAMWRQLIIKVILFQVVSDAMVRGGSGSLEGTQVSQFSKWMTHY